MLPAFVAVAVRVLAGDIMLETSTTYDNYLWQIGALFAIFLAAQAPELVVNDIRHRVLPLYFSRPMSRIDYVAAKLAALTHRPPVADAPAGAHPLPRPGARRRRPARRRSATRSAPCPAIVGSGVLHAVVLASVGLAISSPRLAARLRGRRGPGRLPHRRRGQRRLRGGRRRLRRLRAVPQPAEHHRRRAPVAVRRRGGRVAGADSSDVPLPVLRPRDARPDSPRRLAGPVRSATGGSRHERPARWRRSRAGTATSSRSTM